MGQDNDSPDVPPTSSTPAPAPTRRDFILGAAVALTAGGAVPAAVRAADPAATAPVTAIPYA
ncbi:MAG: hypothetical protein JWO31_3189, partial [Phycisphaerales bacterium]|nr:hypothetical protein [Phycisphaerales bacterium]